MLLEEYTFKDVLNKIIMLPISIKDVMVLKDDSHFKDADTIVGYCYNDHNIGLSIRVLGLALKVKDNFVTYASDPKMCLTYRFASIANREATIKVLNEALMLQYHDIIEMINKLYAVTIEIEASRRMDFIDHLRYKYNPDDIKICLLKDGLNVETVWGRIESINQDKRVFICKLLNEPYQDYGCHIDELVEVRFYLEPNQEDVIAYLDLNIKT